MTTCGHADEAAAAPPARRSARARPGRPPCPAPPSLPTVTEDEEMQEAEEDSNAEPGQPAGHVVKSICMHALAAAHVPHCRAGLAMGMSIVHHAYCCCCTSSCKSCGHLLNLCQ